LIFVSTKSEEGQRSNRRVTDLSEEAIVSAKCLDTAERRASALPEPRPFKARLRMHEATKSMLLPSRNRCWRVEGQEALVLLSNLRGGRKKEKRDERR
jgi:hypothetical protein